MNAALTRPEEEIMKLVAKGCTNKQICRKAFYERGNGEKIFKKYFLQAKVKNRIGELRKVELI